MFLLTACGSNDDEPATGTTCPEAEFVVGQWEVTSVTVFDYVDNRPPPDQDTVLYSLAFFEDGTGEQTFPSNNTVWNIEWRFPFPQCFANLTTTTSGGSQFFARHDVIEATSNRQVWRTVIDLRNAGAEPTDPVIGTQEITLTMTR